MGYDVVAMACADRYVVGLDISKTVVEQSSKTSAALYDHHSGSFFCAFEPSMRPLWAQRMEKLLKPDGELITLMFPMDERSGCAPYKVSVSEYENVLIPLGFEEISIADNELAVTTRKGLEKIGRWRKKKTSLAFTPPCDMYDACMDVTESDHKPVRCKFHVKIEHVDRSVRRQEFGRIIRTNEKVIALLNDLRYVPETVLSSNNIVLQNQDTFVLRITNKCVKENAVFRILCESHSTLGEDEDKLELHPFVSFGFPRWLEVMPAAGTIKPDSSVEVTVHHEEFHTLEEFVDGIPENWWCEDTWDKEAILVVNVQGSCSTETVGHKVHVRHCFSAKNLRVDSIPSNSKSTGLKKNEGDSGSKSQKKNKGDSSSKTQKKSDGDSSSKSQKKNKGDSNSKSQKKSDGDSNSKTQKKSDGDSNSKCQKKNEGDSNSKCQKKSDGDSNSKSQKKDDGDLSSKSQKESEGDSSSKPQKKSEGDSSSCKFQSGKKNEGDTSSYTSQSENKSEGDTTSYKCQSWKKNSSNSSTGEESRSGHDKR
ncbi:hypothetical protein F2Q68_00001852 [Brassica cretica]|uniref:IP5PC-F immunoglobulin-like domain-containing protein n=3 Tax=Brassica TaxID=3705 RepID=A0A8S9JEI5_BRACR|nr:hypothetical protein F2Q68_00001852 [Brassica cretica]